MAGESSGMGKYEMLKLTAVKDGKDIHDSFDVLVNPENLKESYNVVLEEKQGAGSKGFEGKYLRTEPGELDFTLIFDSTGIFDSGLGDSLKKSIASFNPLSQKNKDISEDLGRFKKYFLEYDGNFHEPLNAKFEWGYFSYTGRISKIDIEYKLFNTDGLPIRAYVMLKVDTISSKERENLTKQDKSPDMTHYRTVKGGDTIQLLTKEIYGDVKYYLEVARVNKLIQFRNLKPGSKLVFPPIEKM